MSYIILPSLFSSKRYFSLFFFSFFSFFPFSLSFLLIILSSSSTPPSTSYSSSSTYHLLISFLFCPYKFFLHFQISIFLSFLLSFILSLLCRLLVLHLQIIPLYHLLFLFSPFHIYTSSSSTSVPHSSFILFSSSTFTSALLFI